MEPQRSTDDFVDIVPQEILNRTASMRVSHTAAAVDNFQAILDEAEQKECAILDLTGNACPYC